MEPRKRSRSRAKLVRILKERSFITPQVTVSVDGETVQLNELVLTAEEAAHLTRILDAAANLASRGVQED